MESMHPIELALLESFTTLSQQAVDAKSSALFIGYSGGLDSSVLLHAASQLLQTHKIQKLVAVHLNHQLQPLADHWQLHCQTICDEYPLPLLTRQCDLLAQDKTSELDARQVRYQFFSEVISDGGSIALAHHQDDQVETLLFRLFRGTGLHGLKGIPRTRQLGNGLVFRPLLDFSRHELLAYAEKKRLKWIEDPSNQSNDYHRNFIRNKVLPLIETQWSNVKSTLLRFSLLASEQSQLLDEVAQQDLLILQKASLLEKYSVETDAKPTTPLKYNITINDLVKLSLVRQKNCLHFWIRDCLAASPSYNDINQIIQQIGSQKENTKVANKDIEIRMAGGLIRSYCRQLFCCATEEPKTLIKHQIWHNIEQPIKLNNGCVLSQKQQQQVLPLIRIPLADEIITIRARIGGENILPHFRQHSTDLKQIYQELKVPPWQRKWLPIIYYNDNIVAVPGVFVAKDFIVEKDGVGFSLTRKN